MQKYSFNTTYLLQFAAVLLMGLSFWCQTRPDPDLGWHLFGGAWIFQHGQVPFVEYINSFHKVWHDYHWLAQVIWYSFYSLLGYEGLRLLLALIMALLATVLLDIVHLSHPESKKFPVVSVLLVGLSLFFIYQVTTIRPQMLSFLSLAYVIRRLLQKPTGFEPWYLFGWACFTVNIHVNWIFIPILWVIFRVLPYLTKTLLLSPLYVWGTLALLGCAGFISPYGILPGTGHAHTALMNYVLLFDYFLIPPETEAYIGEMSALFSSSGKAFALTLLVVFLVSKILTWDRAKNNLPLVLAGVLGFALLVDKVKMYGLFALIGLPIISFCCIQTGINILQIARGRFLKNGALAKIALVSLILLALPKVVLESPWLNDNTHALYDPFPKEACEFIAKQRFPSIHGYNHTRVLTHFNFGGWCRWFMYEQDRGYDARVTIDGRTQYLPGSYVTKQARLYELGNGWESTLKQWRPDIVVAPIESGLAQALAHIPSAWEVVNHDQLYLVVKPKTK